jgi:hypothetical protein
MKRHTAFPGQYLKSADIGTARPVVEISHVTMEKVGEDEKPVLHFAGKEKGMVLNGTCFDAIVEISGEDDSDNWAGHRVQLYVDKNVQYQGKRVEGLRICAPPANKPAQRPAKRAPEPEPEPDPDFEVGTLADEDSIPF